MKKLVLLIVLALSLPLSSYSQTLISGSLDCLKGEKAILVKWDFSNTVFEKKFNEKDWIAVVTQEDWEKAKTEGLQVFTEEANQRMKNSSLFFIRDNSSVASNYTMVIAPESYDRKGNNRSLFIFLDKDGNEKARLVRKGDGGHFGSLANLMGDGYEESGRAIGKYLQKRVPNR